MQNNRFYHFGLRYTNDGTGFQLYPKTGADQGIYGVWLQTREKVNFNANPFSAATFLVTAELQGCSLYISYDNKTDMLTLFHHYRRTNQDGAGNRELVYNGNGYYVYNDATQQEEYYQDVLALEEYFDKDITEPFVCPLDDSKQRYGVTPFLYRDQRTRDWIIIWFGYCFDVDINTRELSGLKLAGPNGSRFLNLKASV